MKKSITITVLPSYGQDGEWYGVELDRLRTWDRRALNRWGWRVSIATGGTGSPIPVYTKNIHDPEGKLTPSEVKEAAINRHNEWLKSCT